MQLYDDGEHAMKILAHRGYWGENIKNNSPEALHRALENGFGFESDIRDYCGKMVISHDIATADSQNAEEVLDWLAEFQDEYCFAINIKSDGLKTQLLEHLRRRNLKNYFTFDMSVPQMIEYRELGLTYFTRQSEVEDQPVLYEDAAGIWIDGFFGDVWIDEALLQSHIAANKTICLVSPDLHKREHMEFWKRLRSYSIAFERIMLCTDHPMQAREFFKDYL